MIVIPDERSSPETGFSQVNSSSYPTKIIQTNVIPKEDDYFLWDSQTVTKRLKPLGLTVSDKTGIYGGNCYLIVKIDK